MGSLDEIASGITEGELRFLRQALKEHRSNKAAVAAGVTMEDHRRAFLQQCADERSQTMGSELAALDYQQGSGKLVPGPTQSRWLSPEEAAAERRGPGKVLERDGEPRYSWQELDGRARASDPAFRSGEHNSTAE